MKKSKKLILNVVFYFLVISQIGTAIAHESAENTHLYFQNRLTYEVTSKQVNGWMQNDEPHEDFVILDVRAETDFKAGHLPGAVNMPYTKYHAFEGPETEFPELKKEVLYIVLCYGGECNKSHVAAQKLSSLGYKVKKLIGGFKHWESQGYPVKT